MTYNLLNRVASSLREKIMLPEEAAEIIESNMVLGCSGFGSVGYPKIIPEAIVNLGKADELTVITGAGVGEELDGVMASAGIVKRRFPYQSDKIMRNKINNAEVDYCDMHLSRVSEDIYKGIVHVDVAIIECAAILEEGIVPSASLGNSACFVNMADKIILEVNENIPLEILGIHDVYLPSKSKEYIGIFNGDERIGLNVIPYNSNKIAAIIFSNKKEKDNVFKESTDSTKKIAKNIIEIINKEVELGHVSRDLPPIQAGIGSVTNCILENLRESNFKHLKMFTEVIQDSTLQLIKDEIVDFASATSLSLSSDGLQDFYDNIEFYKKHIIIRTQDISNSPEVIKRLDVISINTAIDFDIYGNVNSSHIMGENIMNGIGGSGDFARNAGLTIFATESTAKNGSISCVLPIELHIDHTEHDVDFLVTEQGYADIRWKSPKERTELIINKCSNLKYKESLNYYLHDSYKRKGHIIYDSQKIYEWNKKI